MRISLLIFLFGTICSGADLPEQSSVVVDNTNARFVLKQVGSFRSDIFMIDTKTGRLWRLVATSDDKTPVTALEPVKYLLANGPSSMPEDTMAQAVVDFDEMSKKHPDMKEYIKIQSAAIEGQSIDDTIRTREELKKIKFPPYVKPNQNQAVPANKP